MFQKLSYVRRPFVEWLEARTLLSTEAAPLVIACAPFIDNGEALAAEVVSAAPPFPTDQTFLLHSRPTATKVIYLDFDGYTTSGTSWNTSYNGGADFYTPPFSSEGDSTFTTNELERIQKIWQRVVEDYAPFDVDVTTEEPSLDDLRKFGGGDTRWGVRVVIGGNGSWYGSAGGVAYVGSFNWSSDTPCFVFEDMLSSGEKNIAEATSHEAGHTLGLSHDGRTSPSEEYYAGQGSGATGWAPIMGVGYYRSLTQWSKGEYLNAKQTQDDLAIISSNNGFSYRPDDYGNTAATASILGSSFVTGVIERTTDVDAFSIPSAGGNFVLNVDPFSVGPNLDILAELRDGSGNLVASSNPADTLNASFNLSLSPGTYTLLVSGVGKGDPLTTGYTDYGSLGQYTITTLTPGNDNFASRIVLSGASVNGAGTNTGATKEVGEPDHAGNAGGRSVWWSWTAPTTDTYSISTAGSSFDTLLGIYTGSSVSGLTPIASNDNAPSSTTSLVSLNAIAGTTYQIAVDGRDGANGSVSLAVFVPSTTPIYISPADGAMLSSRPVTFDWQDVPSATAYDFYLNNAVVAANLTASTWTGLATGVSGNFTWRVVAKNAQSSSSGATWNFTLDSTAPTASLSPATPVTGASFLDFNITYSDTLTGIDVSTLDENDVYVTGSGGFNSPASFVSVNNPANGSPRVVTYRMAAPGGFWNDADNGSYAVMQVAAQVKDAVGNARPGSPIGTITASGLGFTWVAAGTLNVAFDGSATPLLLERVGSDIRVTRGATVLTFSSITAIDVFGADAADTLQINGELVAPLTVESSNGNDTLSVIGGSYTFAADVGALSSNLAVSIASGASAVFQTTQHLRSLNVPGSAVLEAGGGKSLVVGGLSVSGRLDLTDNELFWQSQDTTASLNTLTTLIASGRNGGNWSGNGIVTSMGPAASPATLTTLGVSAGAQSVIARYTYAGDMNLDRVINGDDYFAIDSGYSASGSTYSDGDLDFNGRINADDYWLIDANYNKSGSVVFAAPMTAPFAQGSAISLALPVDSTYERLFGTDDPIIT